MPGLDWVLALAQSFEASKMTHPEVQYSWFFEFMFDNFDIQNLILTKEGM